MMLVAAVEQSHHHTILTAQYAISILRTQDTKHSLLFSQSSPSTTTTTQQQQDESQVSTSQDILLFYPSAFTFILLYPTVGFFLEFFASCCVLLTPVQFHLDIYLNDTFTWLILSFVGFLLQYFHPFLSLLLVVDREFIIFNSMKISSTAEALSSETKLDFS